MFASSRRLHLELLCTHGTPVKKNLGYLPAFPIVISFLDYFRGGDVDNLIAALEHPDRVRVIDLNVPCSLLEELSTVIQRPFPALRLLQFQSEQFESTGMPAIPETFLGGSAQRLQKISIYGIPFPAAPTLLLSAHDLVDVELCEIPPTGYIPPEAIVASLAALPSLKHLTFGFESGMSYPDQMHLLPITRTVLPALTRFYFHGHFGYFEDFVAQIDAPRLHCLHIEYLEHQVTDFQIPQLCKFIDRSEKLKLSRFRRADLFVEPFTAVIELVHRGRSSFHLSIQEEAIGQVVNQISAMLSNVDHLFISSDALEDDVLGDGIRWLELFHPFTAVKVLSVDDQLSLHIPLALKNVTGERAAEVLPALELLCLDNESVTSVKKFVAARQSVGRPVTVLNPGSEFKESLNTLDIGE